MTKGFFKIWIKKSRIMVNKFEKSNHIRNFEFN